MTTLRLLRCLLAALGVVACGVVAAQPAEVGCPPPPPAPSAEQTEAGMRVARDRGFLWRVRRDGRESYLYATVHAARREWMYPGPSVRAALMASDTLALEIDPLDAKVQAQLAAAMAAPPDMRLPAPLRERVERRARADCLPAEAIAQLAPEMQITTLTVIAGRRQGLEAAYGIDIFLAGFGRGLNQRIVSLETPEQQLRALRSGSRAEAIALVASGLDELESGRAQALLERLVRSWADSDFATLDAYAQWCECVNTPAEAAAMRRLLDERNPLLAAGIDALHRRGARVFAAVGSLHMIGPHGLPALLAKLGYQVERVRYAAPAPDIVALWDFDDPARSEAVFRAELAHAHDDLALSLRTQIARTYSLRSRFDEAHALLDAVDAELPGAGPEPRVRALLERGRTWRSAKQPERARPLFLQAAEIAARAGLEYLAVDALHMIALVEPNPDAQLEANRRALAAARAALDPRARDWEASLANNIGMSLHEAGRDEEALQSFRSALAARERIGTPAAILDARWMVAWSLRALHRHDEALAMLYALEREHTVAGSSDGVVFEEIGENLLAQGEAARAKPYFARAHELLAKDTSLERPDAQRLARLLELSR